MTEGHMRMMKVLSVMLSNVQQSGRCSLSERRKPGILCSNSAKFRSYLLKLHEISHRNLVPFPLQPDGYAFRTSKLLKKICMFAPFISYVSYKKSPAAWLSHSKQQPERSVKPCFAK